MTHKEAQSILEKHIGQLMEHFGAVQIHASFPDGLATCGIHDGGGDWYARQGLAHEFIEQDKAQEIGASIARYQEGEE